ncbi:MULTISPECIES: shikimate dehydrogenase [Paraliobacillus]|uniref:shikimate dehydrogenase n=1 Tax=Paraliobacillus TaxID=200903 RepID=UPI000DD459B0|nr:MULTISPECIES: shikimate dehydrogenase [Paraliobacillus]
MKLGLIGYPIKHSLSPWIHQQFLQQIDRDGTYLLYETERENFRETVEKLKEDKLDGFNVTVPYKQSIMKYLDEVDTYAALIGAVNTVVFKNGKWVGYNTDGAGYLTAMQSQFPMLFSGDKRVLVLGAGGAARGIFYALCGASFETVDIANRTLKKATDLLPLNRTDKVNSRALSFQEAEKHVQDYDLIIQTTSVGMKPVTQEQIISLEYVNNDTVVSDIVYQPLMTQFLLEAQHKGASIHQGHMMLLYQAKLAFQLWSGKEVTIEPLLSGLEDILKGNE